MAIKSYYQSSNEPNSKIGLEYKAASKQVNMGLWFKDIQKGS